MSWLVAMLLMVLSAVTVPAVAPDGLLTRLQADHDVRMELLGKDQPRGEVLCGINVLGHEGDNTYAWLLCGDFRTGPDAELMSGGSDPVVIRPDGVRFPSHAHRFEDIDAMFPPELVDRVKQGQIPVTPSQEALVETARGLPAPPHCDVTQLSASHDAGGGAALGTYYLTLEIINRGDDCVLTTGSLELWADGKRVAALDLGDHQDLVRLPSRWRYRLDAGVGDDCFPADTSPVELALSDPGAGAPQLVVAGGGASPLYARCGRVGLMSGGWRAGPSR